MNEDEQFNGTGSSEDEDNDNDVLIFHILITEPLTNLK